MRIIAALMQMLIDVVRRALVMALAIRPLNEKHRRGRSIPLKYDALHYLIAIKPGNYARLQTTTKQKTTKRLSKTKH